MEVTDEQLTQLKKQMAELYRGARVVQNARSKKWSICRPHLSGKTSFVNEWVHKSDQAHPHWLSKVVWADERSAVLTFMFFPEDYKWLATRV